MRLKKLEIIGFKSFCEKVAVEFPPGISAVVGPNGCGKSNIIDALRWVMGEQSAKQLRGKSMEDVIFAGTRGKPPLNMAEVTLTLANDNGTAPVEFNDYSEISITRRQYRSGERVYLINRQGCRLKDILNIFLGSGMGSKSYAVIQQGNIGAITDAGPDERRVFIEEAAGITRFKSRKQEALSKVQSTEQNLLRLEDIIGEIQRQMTGLQRQAKKAALYKRYQARIRQLDLHLALHQHDVLAKEAARLETLLQTQRDADLAHSTALQEIDAAVAQIKFERTRKHQEMDDQRQRRHELQRTVDRVEATLAHRREEIERLRAEREDLEAARADIAAKNEEMARELEQLAATVVDFEDKAAGQQAAVEAERLASDALRREQAENAEALETANTRLMELVAEEARHRNIQQTASSNREQIERRLRRLDEEAALAADRVAEQAASESAAREDLEELQKRMAAAAEEIGRRHRTLDEHNRHLAERVREVQTLDYERGKLRTRHGALKKMDESLEWYRDGVRAVMQTRGQGEGPETGDGVRPAFAEGIRGLLADILAPQAGYAVATEAVLGEALQYVLVETAAQAAAAVDYLRDRGGGRSGFVPLDVLGPHPTPASPGSERLLDHLEVAPGFQDMAEQLLGHVCMAPDLAAAATLHRRTGQGVVVTPAGDIVSAQGLISGGSSDRLDGILAKKQELRDLEAGIAELDGRLEAERERQTALEKTVREHQQALQRQTAEKQRLTDEALQAEKSLYRIGEETRHARRQLEMLTLEQERLQGERTDAEEEMARFDAAVAETAARIRTQQERVARLTGTGDDLATRLQAFDQRIVDLKLEGTALQARLDNARQTRRRLETFHQDGLERLAQIERDLASKIERRRGAESQTREAERSLQAHYATLGELDSAVEAYRAELEAIESHLADRDREAAALQDHRNAAMAKIRELEMALSTAQVRRDAVVQRLREGYQMELAAARRECTREAAPAAEPPPSPDAMERELEKLRRRIAAIADVNLGAIREYEQLKERFDFLESQREDLVKALADLQKVIRKINQVSQARFVETFDQVNAQMQEVFPKLFEGGTGRLVMTDPERPLESGVEFLIHPPGKKLTRMSLLSGGEKAMAAIAFIFSIFLIRPASFCLLDEIDAPLDDANVMRFNNLLRLIGERSQIVMITHNKRSMEFADTLFGVTMPQKGISKIVSVNLAKTARAA